MWHQFNCHLFTGSCWLRSVRLYTKVMTCILWTWAGFVDLRELRRPASMSLIYFKSLLEEAMDKGPTLGLPSSSFFPSSLLTSWVSLAESFPFQGIRESSFINQGYFISVSFLPPSLPLSLSLVYVWACVCECVCVRQREKERVHITTVSSLRAEPESPRLVPPEIFIQQQFCPCLLNERVDHLEKTPAPRRHLIGVSDIYFSP